MRPSLVLYPPYLENYKLPQMELSLSLTVPITTPPKIIEHSYFYFIELTQLIPIFTLGNNNPHKNG